jgi:hypothetical protein
MLLVSTAIGQMDHSGHMGGMAMNDSDMAPAAADSSPCVVRSAKGAVPGRAANFSALK